jgi:heptosyltransferase I
MRANKFLRFIDGSFCLLLILLKFFGIQNKKPNHFKKVLFIKLSAIGDTILLIPVIRELKKQFPHLSISLIVTDINKDVLQRCPYIDNLFVFYPSRCLNLIYLIRFIYRLKNKRFDVVVDADQWLRISALLAYFSATYRIGFHTTAQHKHYIFTEVINHDRKTHQLDAFFELIKPLGIGDNNINKSLEFWIKEEDSKKLLTVIDINKKSYIVIHPGGHHPQRRWSVKNCAELIKNLTAINNINIIL